MRILSGTTDCWRTGFWNGRSSASRSGLPHRIGLAGLAALGAHVDVGIHGGLMRGAGADLNVNGIFLRAVDQTVTDTAVRLPAGGVTRFEHGLAVVLDERDLAFERIDEFILVPM